MYQKFKVKVWNYSVTNLKKHVTHKCVTTPGMRNTDLDHFAIRNRFFLFVKLPRFFKLSIFLEMGHLFREASGGSGKGGPRKRKKVCAKFKKLFRNSKNNVHVFYTPPVHPPENLEILSSIYHIPLSQNFNGFTTAELRLS